VVSLFRVLRDLVSLACAYSRIDQARIGTIELGTSTVRLVAETPVLSYHLRQLREATEVGRARAWT
jgi:hypothetical protein